MGKTKLGKTLEKGSQKSIYFLLGMTNSGEPLDLIIGKREIKVNIVTETRKRLRDEHQTEVRVLTGVCTKKKKTVIFELDEGLEPISWKNADLAKSFFEEKLGYRPSKATI